MDGAGKGGGGVDAVAVVCDEATGHIESGILAKAPGWMGSPLFSPLASQEKSRSD